MRKKFLQSQRSRVELAFEEIFEQKGNRAKQERSTSPPSILKSPNERFCRSLQQQAKKFYLRDFKRTLHEFKVPKILGMIVLIMFEIQIFTMTFSRNLDDHFDMIRYLQYFRIHPMATKSLSAQQAIAYILLAITCVSIILTAIPFALRLLGFKGIPKRVRSEYFTIASFIQAILLRLTLVPSIEHYFYIVTQSTFETNSVILQISGINMVLAIAWGSLISFHDFEYTFISQDFLAKRESKWGFLTILFIMLISIIYNQSSLSWEIPLVSSIIGLLRIIKHYQEKLFIHASADAISIISRCVAFVISLAVFILVKVESSLEIVLVIMMSPLVGRLAITLSNFHVAYLVEGTNLPSSFAGFIEKIGELLKLNAIDYEDYLKEGKGISFEKFFVSHISNCIVEDCYCRSFQKDYSVNELLGTKLRQRFMEHYTINYFETFFSNKKQLQFNDKRSKFLYFAYLIEMASTPTKAMVEIVGEIRENKYESIKEEFIIHSLFKRARKGFRHHVFTLHDKSQKLDMMSVIDFDEVQGKSSRAVRHILGLLKDFLNYLSQDYFMLEVLREKGIRIIELRNYIERNIRLLFDWNPLSKQVYSLSEIFLDNFNFKGIKISDLIPKSKRLMISTLAKDENSFVNLFKSNTCVIFASLLQPIGTIMRATSSTEHIFDRKRESLIGKNVRMLMPDLIAKYHDQILLSFSRRGNQSTSEFGMRNTFFGTQPSGFIFPLNIKIKLESFMDSEFGVCAFFEKVINGSEYIFCNRKGAIHGMTEMIYRDTFERILNNSISKLAQYDVGRVIPLLSGIISENVITETPMEVTTIMVIPINDKRSGLFRKYKNHPKQNIAYFFEMVEKHEDELEFMEVTLKATKHNTPLNGLYFYYIEVQRIKRVRRPFEIQDMLKTVKKELSLIFGIRIRARSDVIASTRNGGGDGTTLQYTETTFSKPIINELANAKKRTNMILEQRRVKQRYESTDEVEDQLSLQGTDGDANIQRESSDEQLAKRSAYSSFRTRMNGTVHSSVEKEFSIPSQQSNSTGAVAVAATAAAGATKGRPSLDHIGETNSIAVGELQRLKYAKQQTENAGIGIQELDKVNQQIRQLQGMQSNMDHFYQQPSTDIMGSNVHLDSIQGGGGELMDTLIPLTSKQQEQQQMVNIALPERQFTMNTMSMVNQQGKQLAGTKGFANFRDSITGQLGSTDVFSQQQLQLQQQSSSSADLIHLSMGRLGHIGGEQHMESNASLMIGNSSQHFLQEQNHQIRSYQHMPAVEINDLIGHRESLIPSESKDDFAFQGMKGGESASIAIRQKQILDMIFSKNGSKQQLMTSNSQMAYNLNRVQEVEDEHQVNSQGQFGSTDKNRKGEVSTTNQLEELNNVKGDINQAMLDTNSVHSSMTSSHSRKLTIIEAIYSKRPPAIVSGLSWFGVFAYLFLAGTTLIIFLSLLTEFNSELSNFKQMTVPPQLGSFFCQAVADKEFIRVGVDFNLFQYTPAVIAEMSTLYGGAAVESITRFRLALMKALLGDDSDRSGITTFSESVTEMTVEVTEIDGLTQTLSIPLKLSQSLESLVSYFFYYVNFDDVPSTIYVVENTFTLINAFSEVEKISRQAAEINLENVKSLLVYTLIIIEIVTFLIILLVFPIHIIAIKSQEKVIKLIGTFPQDKINLLQDRIDVSLQYLVNKDKQKLSQTAVVIKSKENQKKRTMSHTNSLGTFSWGLTLYAVLMFCVISLYPLMNMMFTYVYTDDFAKNIQETKNIYFAKEQFAALYSANFAALSQVMLTQTVDPDALKQLQNINALNQSVTDGLTDSVETLLQTRSQLSEYSSILQELLSVNVCSAVERLIVYIPDTNEYKAKYNSTLCNLAYGGSLKRGLILAIDEVLQGLSKLMYVYKASSYLEFMGLLSTFQDTKDLYTLQVLEVVISVTVELVKDYMLLKGQDYFDFLEKLQIYFFIYCQIVLLFVFLLGWMVFMNNLKDNLLQSKHLMSLLPLDYVLENPYVMSHINKELTKYKEIK